MHYALPPTKKICLHNKGDSCTKNHTFSNGDLHFYISKVPELFTLKGKAYNASPASLRSSDFHFFVEEWDHPLPKFDMENEMIWSLSDPND